MRLTMRAADSRTLHMWDGLILFWAVLWVVIGTWTGVTLWQASGTGDTISSSGRSIATVGESLAGLADVPLVGGKPGEIGQQVEENGAEIQQRGQEVKGQLRQLALLLGISIVAIPITPVLGLYLPVRLERRREVEGVRRELGRRGLDASLEEYLADRARMTLPYDMVRPLVPDGSVDGDARRRLAEAELARLGIAGP